MGKPGPVQVGLDPDSEGGEGSVLSQRPDGPGTLVIPYVGMQGDTSTQVSAALEATNRVRCGTTRGGALTMDLP